MVQTDIMTLTRFMIEHTRQNPDQADLESLMASIQVRPWFTEQARCECLLVSLSNGLATIC